MLTEPYSQGVLDVCGRRRSPATFAQFAKGRPPINKGRSYPPKAPTVTEIVEFLTAMPDTPVGRRMRALTITGWRSGLRVAELCALEESDLDRANHAITVRCGKGGKRRVSAMDTWGWEQLQPWLDERRNYPVGALFPVLNGKTAGRALATTIVRAEFRRICLASGLRMRLHPLHRDGNVRVPQLTAHRQNVDALAPKLYGVRVAKRMDLESLDLLELLEPIGHRKPPTMPLPRLALAA